MTLTTGSTIAPVTGAPSGGRRVMTLIPATPAEGGERRGQHDLLRTVQDRAALWSATAEARTALREAAAAAAEAAARARSVAELLDEALAVLAAAAIAPDSGQPRAVASQPETDALSPREKEVLALVVEGRTNKAIAEALYVSPNTVKTHVASLLSKLHAESRVQLAAMAATQRLRQSATLGAT